MDENKNNVNNENTQADNMNYSFDFANQVENEAPKDVTPVQTEDASVVATDGQTSNSENVQNVDTSSSEAQTSQAEDVQVAEAPQTPQTENVQAAEAPQTPQTEVPASQDKSQALDAKEEDSIELIKDKKETKRFLIILFVIILLFIIALPFIFNVAG